MIKQLLIPIDNLISIGFQGFTNKLISSEKVLDIYLHTSGESTVVGGGKFGSQRIDSLPISIGLKSFIESTLRRLDALIDLDFRFVNDSERADINFYIDRVLNVGDAGTTLGITLSNSTRSRQWWEILLNGVALQGKPDYLRYAIIHEFGHALGLEHPFDGSDGDYFQSLDYRFSAYPEDTVMAYRSPIDGSWPLWYSYNDILALQKIWGLEAGANPANPQRTLVFTSDSRVADLVSYWQSLFLSSSSTELAVFDVAVDVTIPGRSDKIILNLVSQAGHSGDYLEAQQLEAGSPYFSGSVLNGGEGHDVIVGAYGWDIIDGCAGSDLVIASYGNDVITGGPGRDEIWGGFGSNTFLSELDGAPDLIAIHSDHHLFNVLSGKSENNTNGEKCDILLALDPIDKIRIVGVNTTELTVRAGASAHGVTGVGIYAKGALEALYVGGDLSVSQLTTMVSGDSSIPAMNNQISSYGWTVGNLL